MKINIFLSFKNFSSNKINLILSKTFLSSLSFSTFNDFFLNSFI